jgi:glutamate dehydrogenase/leucine dehydrogenase
MDSGKIKMFVGYRVQYNDGGDVKDISFLMALKCA